MPEVDDGMTKPKTVSFGRLGTGSRTGSQDIKLTIQIEVKNYGKTIGKKIIEDPDRVLTVLKEQTPYVRQILLDVIKQLGDDHPKAKEARKWNEAFIKGLSGTADLSQIFTFLTGISSMSSLMNSGIAMGLRDILKRIVSQLVKSSG